jgi:chaperone modulatory protein CbpM
MISIEVLFTRLPGLHPQDLERWIVNEWVRPDGCAGAYGFRDIDVARVRLIQELRDEMQIDEDVIPIVLSLLDQLYAMRRQIRDLSAALDRAASDDVRRNPATSKLSSDGNQ